VTAGFLFHPQVPVIYHKRDRYIVKTILRELLYLGRSQEQGRIQAKCGFADNLNGFQKMLVRSTFCMAHRRNRTFRNQIRPVIEATVVQDIEICRERRQKVGENDRRCGRDNDGFPVGVFVLMRPGVIILKFGRGESPLLAIRWCFCYRSTMRGSARFGKRPVCPY
jgi:hypothetical protein